MSDRAPEKGHGMSESNGRGKPDLEALRAEIKLTRAELGETVQALAAKADVKARAREQVEQTRQRVLTQVAEARDAVLHPRAHAGAGVEVAGAEGAGAEDAVVGTARRSPVPVPLLIAGALAIAGIILIVRARRR